MLKFSIAGLIMAAIHIAILAYTLAQILAAGAADWTVYWRIFLGLDFPVSLAVVPLTWIVPPSPAGPVSDFANFWWPLAVHGLLGTLWWYIVGMSIGDRLARFRARASNGPDKRS
jgi:hypothetical protein